MKYILISISVLLFSCNERSFKTSAASMENTIMAGQKFTVVYTDKFEKNDIAVFNYYGPDYSAMPEEPGKYPLHWEKRVYRIVAVSGEVVEVKNGELYVNRKLVAPPLLAKYPYLIKSFKIPDLSKIDPQAQMLQPVGDTPFVAIATLTGENVNSLKLDLASIERYLLTSTDTMYAKSSASDNWSVDNYGPLKIPSPGDGIEVTEENYKLYKNIPGIKLGRNKVKENLYFLMGDNRTGAEDSRFMGLISQSEMVGVAKIK
jgi:signal peptidase I